MDQTQRMLAFFGAMLVTAGITALNFEEPAFDQNQLAYIVLAIGALTLIFFIVNKYRSS